jgi:hypothetical protein
MQDELEIFGPILPILRVKSSGQQALAEMTEFVNSRPKPLALYVFTSSDKNTEAVDVVKQALSLLASSAAAAFAHAFLLESIDIARACAAETCSKEISHAV